MRTVPYKEVFDGVRQRLGLDPQAQLPPDESRAIAKNINSRVRTISRMWDWPQWQLTEERAFRQVWNPDHQYLRVSEGGLPDEVFHIPDTSYYTVNKDASSDPPVGVRPTDISPGPAEFWLPLEPVDPYVAYDQICKRSIGLVLSIYSANPRINGYAKLPFSPSYKGIDVREPSAGPTVFLTYLMPTPKYTIVPYVVGRNYQRGEVTFDPTIGECFQALAPTTALPADPTFWRRVPFPEEWADYVEAGAFADCMLEVGQEDDAGTAQIKMARAAKANEEADDFFAQETNAISAQGQKHYYGKTFKKTKGWDCVSLQPPWSGGAVTMLTETCEDELGWVYPTPTPVPQQVWQYHPEITALLGAPNTLQGLPTRTWLTGSLVEIVITVAGARSRQTWNLLAGPANVADPGQVQPFDYDPVSNNKHWEQVS
jgi:hypothetical protein